MALEGGVEDSTTGGQQQLAQLGVVDQRGLFLKFAGDPQRGVRIGGSSGRHQVHVGVDSSARSGEEGAVHPIRSAGRIDGVFFRIAAKKVDRLASRVFRLYSAGSSREFCRSMLQVSKALNPSFD
jgi:hypothetical protein